MTYQVLARKWRPQDFSALVGQEPIVTALRNALREGRIAHAYLFSGIRGVGKTTTARLLAKALNCERGQIGDPCNECLTCREITRGADLDVIEVDAATYSKVEQVRELTESLRYGPARDRYKVVVIDEIHRLSRQAFDALLKIVEEPPPQLVFIFATTEIEAVPATILSRCQEFRFRRVTAAALSAHLREISSAESITVSDTALRLIARAGEGSVRDSVALLDQLATFGAGTIRDEDAARLSGSLDAALYADLLQAILGGEIAAVSALVRRIEDEGWDPRHVYSQFLSVCRDALHLATGGNAQLVDLPGEDAAALAATAKSAGYENLLRLLQLLLAGEESVRRSDAGGLAMEIAWLRAAELPKVLRIEQLLADGGLGAASAPAPARAAVAPVRAAAMPAAQPAPEPRIAAPRAPAPPVPAPPVAASTAPERPDDATAVKEPPPTPLPEPARLPMPSPPRAGETPAPRPTTPARLGGTASLLEEISRRSPPLAGHLSTAEELSLADGVLTVYLPPGPDAELLTRALERPKYREILDEVARLLLGTAGTWRTAPGRKPAAASLVETPSRPLVEATSHPTVQAVLDIFGGSVETVAPNKDIQEDGD